MRTIICLCLSLFFLSACNVLVAGKVKPARKELYEYNNNEEFCKANPNRCVGNIPW